VVLESVGIVFGRLPLLPEALPEGLCSYLRANLSCEDDSLFGTLEDISF